MLVGDAHSVFAETGVWSTGGQLQECAKSWIATQQAAPALTARRDMMQASSVTLSAPQEAPNQPLAPKVPAGGSNPTEVPAPEMGVPVPIKPAAARKRRGLGGPGGQGKAKRGRGRPAGDREAVAAAAKERKREYMRNHREKMRRDDPDQYAVRLQKERDRVAEYRKAKKAKKNG